MARDLGLTDDAGGRDIVRLYARRRERLGRAFRFPDPASIRIASEEFDGDRAVVRLAVSDGGETEVRLELVWEGDTWKVDDYGLRESPGVRLNSNETAAIATLRNVISAQSQFQTTARADENSNGVGEYGTFGELSGAENVRGSRSPLLPPVLSSAFRQVTDKSVERSGYYFRLYLPGADGRGLSEEDVAGAVDPDEAEVRWCCYAWPVAYGLTGDRTFCVNQSGDICATEDPAYSGTNGPEADAAFSTQPGRITGEIAAGATGNDGRTWRQAG